MDDESPITEDELAALEISVPAGRAIVTIRRLIGEVRRLRSDGWRERAAEEIARHLTHDFEVQDSEGLWRSGKLGVLWILNKHRDALQTPKHPGCTPPCVYCEQRMDY